MAVKINYNRLSYSDPAVIRGFDQNVILLQWALQHMTIDGNWLNLKILQRSDAELLALSGALPAIGDLQQDFQSGRNIFVHLAQCHRFTVVQVMQLDALLLAKHPNMAQLLKSYDSTATEESTLYLLFCHWSSLGYHTYKFFMQSTAAAVDIVATFPPMKTLIDALPPLLNGLVLGSSTKSD